LGDAETKYDQHRLTLQPPGNLSQVQTSSWKTHRFRSRRTALFRDVWKTTCVAQNLKQAQLAKPWSYRRAALFAFWGEEFSRFSLLEIRLQFRRCLKTPQNSKCPETVFSLLRWKSKRIKLQQITN